MGKEDRRAKVTPETKAESKRLASLWASKPHPSQAEFGEKYGIGNQSAVGQFLRGDTPLSLKAARGFAEGLGVRIDEFSPRLAMEAAALATVVQVGELSPELSQLATAVEALPSKQRDWVLMMLRESVKLAQETVAQGSANQSDSPDSTIGVSPSAKRRRAA